MSRPFVPLSLSHTLSVAAGKSGQRDRNSTVYLPVLEKPLKNMSLPQNSAELKIQNVVEDTLAWLPCIAQNKTKGLLTLGDHNVITLNWN